MRGWTNDEPQFWQATAFVVFLLVIAAVFASQNCGDGENPRLVRTLQVSGFTDIELGDYSFACGDSGPCKSFVGTGPSGMRVRGSVGCGMWIKGCTVRIEP